MSLVVYHCVNTTVMEERNYVKMNPLEQKILARGDSEIIFALLKSDSMGWCRLSDEFVAEAFAKSNDEVKGFVMKQPLMMSGLIVDKLLDGKRYDWLKRHIQRSHGAFMTPERVCRLLKTKKQSLIDAFFSICAPIVFQDESYASVRMYLSEEGLEDAYRHKYLPALPFTSKN